MTHTAGLSCCPGRLVGALALLLTGGCAQIAYDTVAAEQERQCERMVSAPERQLCLQRVRTARQQADEQRRQKRE
jgi:hypothetical protein